MNILAIGSHPDDIELGCSGTLLKLVERGHSIYYIIATYGENWVGKDKDIRIREQEKAMKSLGINDLKWLCITDGSINVSSEVIDEIEKFIIKQEINVIFSNYPEDTNQDHVEMAKIVKTSGRFCKNIFYYESLSSICYNPNFYFCISDVFNRKLEVINSFESQINKYKKRGMDLIEFVTLKNRLYGIKQRCSYAESFYIERLALNLF